MLHWLTQLRLAQKFTLLGLVTLAMVAFPSALDQSKPSPTCARPTARLRGCRCSWR